jgi:hypothetical protein
MCGIFLLLLLRLRRRRLRLTSEDGSNSQLLL